MRIAFVFSTCANSGPFIVAKNIIDQLQKRSDIAIEIFYIKESNRKIDFNVPTTKVDFFRKKDFSQYDIVHSHGFLGDIFLHLNRKSLKGKSVTTIHQKIKPDYAMNYNLVIAVILEKFWTWCLKDFDGVVALTKEMALYYEGILKKYIYYIYNGISPKPGRAISPEEAAIQSLKNNHIVMGISANLIYRKGVDVVIRALAKPEAGGLALLVIGDGKNKQELLALCNEFGVADRCLFLGYKNNAIDYFKYFDLYIMSSRSEGFGLCVIEAASQSLPVICNNLSVYRELFTDEEVIRFNLENGDSLIEAVNFAIKNKEELSRKIYDKYMRCFTSEVMAENYLEFYNQLLNGTNG